MENIFDLFISFILERTKLKKYLILKGSTMVALRYNRYLQR